MDTVTPTEEKHALAEAGALLERGEAKAALLRAERVRRSALASEDLPLLEEVLRLAASAYARTDGNSHEEAGRLAFSARQNISFVGRKQALAKGRVWIDPFTPERPLTKAVSGGSAAAKREPPSLGVSLSLSFLFCAFWAGAGVMGSSSLGWWFGSMAVWGVYWVVLALLQVRWSRKGYERFYRPVYSWALTAFCALLLSIPADVMFAVPLGDVARGVLFLVAWGAVLAIPLAVPRFRRWLLRQWRPYDDRAARGGGMTTPSGHAALDG